MQSAQWHGRCPGCEAWNTLVEERLPAPASGRGRAASKRSVGGASGARGRERRPTLAARPLRDVGTAPVQRMSTGIGELDRVLGGGLVPGSLVLLGGSPGIGKSTLTNMALGNLQEAGHTNAVRLRRGVGRAGPPARRAPRLGPANAALKVPILAETDLETVLDDDRRRSDRRRA